MEQIKVLIIEDQLLTAEDIASRLRKHNLEVIDIFDNGEEALASLSGNVPDLILMDINLAGEMDGIETAKRIQEKHAIPIIYLSDHTDSQTVNRAKATLPANYLAKPFLEPDLIRAIEIAFHNAKATRQQAPAQQAVLLPKHVFLRTNNQAFIKLAYDDILYLEADKVYCDVITKEKRYKLSISMNHVHEQLDNPDFVRVHRSNVINVNNISALEGNVVHMGEHEIQMSKDYKDALMARLKFIKLR